jgi:hypothetical protein
MHTFLICSCPSAAQELIYKERETAGAYYGYQAKNSRAVARDMAEQT